MCNDWCFKYWSEQIAKEEIEGKKVIEVGSLDVNGSLRSVIQPLNPAEYVGVDITEGRGVDIICDAGDIVERFGKESFDFVVSTELIEHVVDWQKTVSNLKNICRPGGTIIITTRSLGFPYHGYPDDYWRYEIADIEAIFADCILDVLEKDESEPGVFMKAQKPKDFVELDLSGHKLYAMEQPANKKQTLTFTITQGPNKVTITEDLVVKMFDNIDEVRNMGGQQTFTQGPNQVTIPHDVIVRLYDEIQRFRPK